MINKDILADILSVGKINNRILAYKEMPLDFGVYFDMPSFASFQIISRGSAWAKSSPHATPVALNEGDITFFSNSKWHALSANIDSPLEHFTLMEDQVKPLHSEDDCEYPNTTCVFCGCYELSTDIQHPFFSQLPSFIHIPAKQVQEDKKLQALIGILLREGNDNEMGSPVVLNKLIDILLIYVVRNWIKKNSSSSKNTGWLSALNDPKIGHAIALMHREPGVKWTVDKLANQVSMSRASFAKKFTQSIGESPGVYLTRWRIDLSAKLLRESNLPLIEIANTVGYESDTAFSKVFKRQKGSPPGEYRSYSRLAADSNSIQ